MSEFRETTCGRQLSFLLLICVFSSSVWGLARVSAKRIPKPSDGAPSLGALLKPDGTLDLSRGFQGSLDTQGYRMEYSAAGAPRFVPAAPAAGTWDTQFVNANGVQRVANAVVVSGTDVYLGGQFTTAGTTVVNNIARWDGSSWSGLGSGVEGAVYTMAVSGGDLYVGGDFTMAGGAPAGNIAKWNGSSWSALGSGVSGGSSDYVLSLAVSGGNVYVSGQFTTAGGAPAANIAKWNGSAWSALGSGISGQVEALAVSGGDLYAGGQFATAGGISAFNIAKWNGSAWFALGGGIPSQVRALAVSGSDLYAGGQFATAGGVPANNIAKWNGSAWSALGSGVTANPGAAVGSILVIGANVYVNGTFDTAGGNPAKNVAVWNGSAWAALGNGLEKGGLTLYGLFSSLAASGTDIYAAGAITKSGNVEINRIAKWNGSAWSPIGNASNSVNNSVYALAVMGNDVYVAGEFDFAGGVAANNIAKWNGTTWSALGSGLNLVAFSMAVMGGDLYVSGFFSTAGGNPANYIAKWNGSVWSPLGSGLNNGAASLVVSGTNLYAGGGFSTAGGITVNGVACWNGGSWSALGSGMDASVFALAVNGSDLYAGGSFMTAGGVPASRIAKWNGSTWSALGSGVNDRVNTLGISGTDVYAGGRFTQAGGNATGSLAKWNGSSWSQVGGGASGQVQHLLLVGNDLYVGGLFTIAGGNTYAGVAKWDGSAWATLSAANSIDDIPYVLAWQGANLYAGGVFKTLGGTISHYFGRYVSCVSTLTVNNIGDGADASPGDGVCETAAGNGVCTLRAAIQEANALTACSPITINFSVTGTITLTNGDLVISRGLTINGPGAQTLAVSGNNASRIFFISDAPGTTTIHGLGLTNGNGNGSFGNNTGGAIYNANGQGTVTLSEMAIYGNSLPTGVGGGVEFSTGAGGIMNVVRCAVYGNAALFGGGGIGHRGIGTLNVVNSTIVDNQAGSNRGGGIGGYINGNRTINVVNSTIAGNSNGGLAVYGGSPTVMVRNSLIAANSDGDVVFENGPPTFTSGGNNLFGSAIPAATQPTDQVGVNPLLELDGNGKPKLAFNSGTTHTVALLPGSPAIDAGNDCVLDNSCSPAPLGSNLTTDQRGFNRGTGAHVDIGAFESQGFTLTVAGGNNQSAVTSTAFTNPLSVGVSSAFSEPVNGGKVTFTPPGSGASATMAGNPATITGGVAATGTVTANSIVGGPYSVTAAANGVTPTINFSLTNLNSPPTITAQAGVTRQQGAGSSNSQIATVSDAESGANGVTVTVNGTASATVNGVTVSNIVNSGGTVTADIVATCGASSASFTLTATDGHAATATATLNVSVTGITLSSLVNGLTFVPYSLTLTATGGTGSYTFSLVSGTLPPGLALSGNVLSGTPTTAGASIFTIRADDDSNACFGERVYTINIGSTGLMYYPLARPVRLLDTRPGASPNACFQPNAPIAGGTTRTQPARGTCEGIVIPANATTITGHITTVQSGGGSLTLYPSDAPQPNVSNSNYLANEILNNAFTVGLGVNDGAFKLFVGTNTDVVIDVTGYYAPPGAGGLYFHPLPKPIRLLETRTGFSGCQTPGAPLQTATTRTQTGVLTCDGVTIPTGALALVGNATTTNSTGSGYLTLYPADATQPFASSSNFAAGVNRNAPFTVGLSLNGEFNIYTARTTDLVIDVMGYYSTEANDSNGQGLLFNSLGAPLRLLDTRAGQPACYQPGTPMTGGTVYTQDTQIPCTNLTSAARGLVGNVSALNATANGYLTFWPSNAAQPTVATSNYQTGRVFNRHFTVGLGGDVAFKRFAASTTDVIIDIAGFFAP